MNFNEYKEKIKECYINVFKEFGKTIPGSPDEVFKYIKEEELLELYNKNVSPNEAYLFCAMAGASVKKPK